MKNLEKVQVGIEDVLYLLQPLLAEGTHGISHPMESHPTREDDETLQQSLAACYVLQLQVWDSKRKLDNTGRKPRAEFWISKKTTETAFYFLN